MTLQLQNTVNAPATLSDEQRRRVSDALENAQSVNTLRNYAGQLRKFRDWCEHEGQTALPASSEVVAAYAAELVDDGRNMSTVRLAVASIVEAHRRVGLAIQMTWMDAPLQAVQTHGHWKSPQMPAGTPGARRRLRPLSSSDM